MVDKTVPSEGNEHTAATSQISVLFEQRDRRIRALEAAVEVLTSSLPTPATTMPPACLASHGPANLLHQLAARDAEIVQLRAKLSGPHVSMGGTGESSGGWSVATGSGSASEAAHALPAADISEDALDVTRLCVQTGHSLWATAPWASATPAPLAPSSTCLSPPIVSEAVEMTQPCDWFAPGLDVAEMAVGASLPEASVSPGEARSAPVTRNITLRAQRLRGGASIARSRSGSSEVSPGSRPSILAGDCPHMGANARGTAIGPQGSVARVPPPLQADNLWPRSEETSASNSLICTPASLSRGHYAPIAGSCILVAEGGSSAANSRANSCAESPRASHDFLFVGATEVSFSDDKRPQCLAEGREQEEEEGGDEGELELRHERPPQPPYQREGPNNCPDEQRRELQPRPYELRFQRKDCDLKVPPNKDFESSPWAASVASTAASSTPSGANCPTAIAAAAPQAQEASDPRPQQTKEPAAETQAAPATATDLRVSQMEKLVERAVRERERVASCVRRQLGELEDMILQASGGTCGSTMKPLPKATYASADAWTAVLQRSQSASALKSSSSSSQTWLRHPATTAPHPNGVAMLSPVFEPRPRGPINQRTVSPQPSGRQNLRRQSSAPCIRPAAPATASAHPVHGGSRNVKGFARPVATATPSPAYARFSANQLLPTPVHTSLTVAKPTISVTQNAYPAMVADGRSPKGTLPTRPRTASMPAALVVRQHRPLQRTLA